MLELEGTLEIILSNSPPTQYGSPLQYPFISFFPAYNIWKREYIIS